MHRRFGRRYLLLGGFVILGGIIVVASIPSFSTEKKSLQQSSVDTVSIISPPMNEVHADTNVYAGGMLSKGNGDGTRFDRTLPDTVLSVGENIKDAIQLTDTTYVILTTTHTLYLIDKTGTIGSVALSAGVSYKLFRFSGASAFGVVYQTNSCDSFGCYYRTYVNKYNYSLGLMNSSPVLALNSSYSNVDHDTYKELIPAPNGGFYTIVYYQPYGGTAAMKVKRYNSSCALDVTFGTSGEMAYPLFTNTYGEVRAYTGNLAAVKITQFSSGGTWSRYELRNLSDFSLVSTMPISPGVRLGGYANGWFIGEGGQLYDTSLNYVGGLPMPYGNIGELSDIGGGQFAGLENGRLVYYSGNSLVGGGKVLVVPYQKLGLSALSFFSGSMYGYATSSDTWGNSTIFSMKYSP